MSSQGAETASGAVPEPEWAEQWSLLDRDADQPPELFLEWIAPNKLELFDGARALDAGCGGGHQAALVATRAREVVALDRNFSGAARRRLSRLANVKLVEGDLLSIDAAALGGPFDVVYSIGVLHHTADPDRGYDNLLRQVRPGGRIVVWVYSREGNQVARLLVEPLRKVFLRFLPRKVLWALSWAITLPALAVAHTLYRLPLRFLPLYEYLARSRSLSMRKVAGNVFDKLNAPHTDFISRARIEGWLGREGLSDVHLASHLGVSWCASATKR